VSTAGTSAGAPGVAAQATPRWRVNLARVLIVLSSILAALSLIAGYVRYQALDTPTVENAAGEMIANDAIRSEIAITLVDQLYSNIDVAAALRQELPADQQRLAGPLSGALRELTDRAANRVLQGPRVQAAWVQSVATAHKEVLRLLDDRATAIKETNGVVVLDLKPLVIQLGDRIAIVGNLAQRLPPDTGQIQIMKADQLRNAQRLTHLLDISGRFLWLLTLLVAAIAVWVAPGRRRKTLRSLALGAIVAGLLVLMVRRVAGNYVVDGLVPAGTTREAVKDAWEILTSLLVDGGRTLVGIGVVLLLGTWLAGETRSGRASRREISPLLARWEIAYGTVIGLMLLLIWWGPTVQFHRWQFIVVFTALLALGMWALRRLTLHEYPDAVNQPASAPFAHAWHAVRGGEHPREQPPPQAP
jgi:hypothetical protein